MKHFHALWHLLHHLHAEFHVALLHALEKLLGLG